MNRILANFSGTLEALWIPPPLAWMPGGGLAGTRVLASLLLVVVVLVLSGTSFFLVQSRSVWVKRYGHFVKLSVAVEVDLEVVVVISREVLEDIVLEPSPGGSFVVVRLGALTLAGL
jgi:hypothetical protein